MALFRLLYWPPLAFARWLKGESDWLVRERQRTPTDIAFYRVAFCILWTALLALVAFTLVLVL